MPDPMLEPLLSLLGHELRAPAGVVGGYLALLERDADALTPAQRQALAGARRGQQTVVDLLDDVRRLIAAWQLRTEPETGVPLTRLANEVEQISAARGVVAPVTVEGDGLVARRGQDTSLQDALAVVAEVVARESGGPTVVSASAATREVLWRVRAAAATTNAVSHEPEAFDRWRPGLGVRLVVAAAVVEANGGTLVDVRASGQRAGVDVTLRRLARSHGESRSR